MLAVYVELRYETVLAICMHAITRAAGTGLGGSLISMPWLKHVSEMPGE